MMNKLILIIGFLCLTSCSGSDGFQDLKDYINKLNHDIAAHQKTAPANFIYQPIPATYQKSSPRTPFESTAAESAKVGTQFNPLERYPLNLLNFVGTVMEANKEYAYIATPDGKIYQVTIGDTLGDHSGTITQIRSKEIELKEQVLDEGKMTSRVVTLQLKEERNGT